MSVTLVTGSAGFIGSHVTERLLAQGETVVGVDNFDPFYDRRIKARNLEHALLHANFRLIEADIRDAEAISRLFADYSPQRVIHLAAKAGIRPSIRDPRAYVDTNVSGTLNLLLSCASSAITHFVFASSSSVYGNAARTPFAENDITDQPESPYAATKKAAEALCFTYHRLLGIPITCLRFFTVYGPRQRPDLAIHKFARLIEDGRSIPFYGTGASSRDYTYVDDIVTGILAALEKPSDYAIYNLGNRRPISLNQMVETLERALGKAAILDRQPDQPGDVETTCADISLANREIGYSPDVTFEEGISRFVAWLRITA